MGWSSVEFLGVYPVPEGIFVTTDGNGFAAAATIYATFRGEGGAVANTESLAAEVRGHFEGTTAVVDKIKPNMKLG